MKGIFALSLVILTGLTQPAFADASSPASVQIKGAKIYVTDLDRSVRFYTRILGLKVARTISEFPGKPANEIILTQTGTFDLGPAPWIVLKVPSSSEGAAPSHTGTTGQLVIIARDIPSLVARTLAAGYTARSFDHGISVLQDPDGHQIEVLPAPASDTPAPPAQ